LGGHRNASVSSANNENMMMCAHRFLVNKLHVSGFHVQDS
jgi:hypothetical protein